MVSKAQLEGSKRYLSKLDDIKVRVPKGRREELKAFAESQGKSLNSFIVEAIAEKIEREKEPT